MTIIDHNIVRLLESIRVCCDISSRDVGKVLIDSLLRAQLVLDAASAASTAQEH